ncbi:hypothetical protein [Haladaptatus halobius]|uniref:hypothetical protein n=1 Tax=Haladaptatus halobius TaxID=2884875 RepID=UPI001D0AF0F2|nr:hypothetical protein [Haladaptatus halobius]
MALAVVATVFSGAFATPALAGGSDYSAEKPADGSSSGDTQSNECTQSGDSASGSGSGFVGVGVGANANVLNSGDNQEQTCSNVD